MSLGDYVKTEYINDQEPAIDEDNLNNNEDKTDELDKNALLSRGFNLDTYKNHVLMKSVKLIDNFEDYTLWTASGTATLSKDYARRFGINRIRIEENDNVAGYLGMYKTISSLDLETFQDGLNTSSTSDLIQFAFVLTDAGSVHLNVRVRLGTDASNYYEWIISGANLAYGTNLHSNPKSSFTTTGSPSWGAITYISIEWESSINQSGEALRAEWIDMERVEDGGSVANPWVLDNGGGNWNIKLLEPVLNSITFLNQTGNISIAVGGNGNETTDPVLKVYEDTENFYLKTAMLVAGPGMTGGVMWYQDSNNYIQILPSDYDGYFMIREVIGGVEYNTVTYSYWSLSFKEKFYIYVEKKGAVIQATVKQASKKMELSYQTSLTGNGDVYISSEYYNQNGWYGGNILEKLIVGNSDIANPIDWDWSKPFVLIKYDDQDITNDTSLDQDLELFVVLPPDTIFLVEAYLTVSAASNTPDAKIGWDINDNEMINDVRWCLGNGYNSTNNDNSNAIQIRRYNASTEVPYAGMTSANAIREHFLIKTGPNDSNTMIELLFCQRTSSADYVRMQSGSHIVFTKVNAARTPYNLSY